MTKNIRASAPEGAEYFKVMHGGVYYFRMSDSVLQMWFEGNWEPMPHLEPRFMELHSLSMGGHVFVIGLLFVLVPILCFALLG